MSKKAVLLVNLGSPESTRVRDVRAYLKEFLTDERVIDVPFVRKFIVPQIILRTRPKRSAEAYKRIWTKEGSPLLVISRQQQELLQDAVDIPVFLAMRYGEPSISDVLADINGRGITELFIIPMYPHYAMSSYETVVVKVEDVIRENKYSIKTTLQQPFYNDPSYIKALAASAGPYLEEGFDMLLFSFHGIPERHLTKGDPSHAHCLSENCCSRKHPAHATCYRHQCLETVDAFLEETNISQEKSFVSFQSRLGKEPWLSPYTDATIERLASEGCKRLLVMMPAFVADCLETLEEIGIEGHHNFIEHGGEHMQTIPCLNDHPEWIRFLADKVNSWIQT
ncbi:MAG: ferrochelatase [Opitutales bacterium]|nr:ferrochelatase [Opitutales bacterium]